VVWRAVAPHYSVDGAESVYFSGAYYSQRNRALAGELPNAHHVCVPGVTHAMPLQDPVAVARRIEGFVRRYPFTVRKLPDGVRRSVLAASDGPLPAHLTRPCSEAATKIPESR
jgi:hypothetical protein